MTTRHKPPGRKRAGKCAECGRTEAHSCHVHHGNDVNNPRKHWFEPPRATDGSLDIKPKRTPAKRRRARTADRLHAYQRVLAALDNLDEKSREAVIYAVAIITSHPAFKVEAMK